MSIRYEFYGELHGDQLQLPSDIAARFRLKGIRRVHVVASSAEVEEATLGRRGIAPTTIDTIAQTQHYDRDVALSMLGGEGIAAGTALAERLGRLRDTEPEASQPEASQPEASQPEASQPEASQPEASQPEASQ